LSPLIFLRTVATIGIHHAQPDLLGTRPVLSQPLLGYAADDLLGRSDSALIIGRVNIYLNFKQRTKDKVMDEFDAKINTK
jgi:hypothetical protein